MSCKLELLLWDLELFSAFHHKKALWLLFAARLVSKILDFKAYNHIHIFWLPCICVETGTVDNQIKKKKKKIWHITSWEISLVKKSTWRKTNLKTKFRGHMVRLKKILYVVTWKAIFLELRAVNVLIAFSH